MISLIVLSLARVLSVASEASLLIRLSTKTISNSNQLQTGALGPLNDPRSQLLYSRRIRFVHEGNVAVAAGASVLEERLALGGGDAVPVLGVNVHGHGGVAERSHCREELTAGVEVWWADVGWLDADEVGEGLVEACHLLGDLIGAP